MGQVLQSKTVLLQNSTASSYHKVRQELVQSGPRNLLQSEAIIITKWVEYYMERQSFLQSSAASRYYKVGQELL